MASGSFTRAAADTQRQSCNGDTHQIWAPITNPSTGLFGWFISGPWYIDLTGNRLADGTKFQVWEQTGNPPYPDNTSAGVRSGERERPAGRVRPLRAVDRG